MALNGLIAANNLSDVVDIERTWDNIGSNFSATVSVPSPTLDLNFAGNKSLVDEISGNNLITFSRASTGTFVGSNGLIQTAASGVPRFDHNPATGESLGLLVEEARTNLLVRSEEFDNASWTPTNATVAANATTSPGGSATAESLLETTANGAHAIVQSVTTTNTRHTVTFFVKSNGRTRLAIGGNSTLGGNLGAGIFFDLSTNSYVSGAASGAVASVQVFNNDWKRISYTWDALAGTGNLGLYLVDSGTNLSYTGDASKGIYLWGAQLETGSFPTSYIPTTTATVTRAADVASITGANFSSWYNQSQGTLFSSFKTSTTDANMGLFAVYQAAALTTNRISLRPRNSFADTAGAQQFFFSSVSVSTNQQTKMAWGFGSTATLYKDGTSAGSDGSVTLSSVLDTAGIGVIESANSQLNGTIARITYYPVRLSNITLQALTTYGPVSSFPYSFSIKGRDILALKEVNKTSTRDFVSIKGLTSKAQPRITTASQYAASGVALRNAAMLKVAPTTAGNYFFSSGLTLSGTTVQINGTNALSIATSPFSSSTATVPLLFAGLRPQANWRFSEAMTSGTIASPELAIPIETSDFLLFIKTGQS